MLRDDVNVPRTWRVLVSALCSYEVDFFLRSSGFCSVCVCARVQSLTDNVISTQKFLLLYDVWAKFCRDYCSNRQPRPELLAFFTSLVSLIRSDAALERQSPDTRWLLSRATSAQTVHT